MASSIIIKTKCLELARLATVMGLVQVLSLVPSAIAQQHYSGSVCEKYCFASCSDYFQGPEFTICVDANIRCNCSRKFSFKNPFTIAVIVILVLFGISLIACCYRFSRKSRVSLSNRVIASPVVSNVDPQSLRHPNTIRTGHTVVVAAPILSNGKPAPKSDVPPEYCAPPPYNECVIGMEYQKY